MLEVSNFDATDEELERRGRVLDALRYVRELERRRCEEDFSFFARQFWPIIEPSTPYIHGRHVEAIVDHLNACLPRWIPQVGDTPGHYIPGQIRKLLIEMPFRHGKSSFVTVLWPAYIWTIRPEFRWLTTSYALGLAVRDAMRMRVVIQSQKYQSLWGDRFQLLSDQNRNDRFTNSRMGYRMVASKDSGATGEGGDGVMCDDAHNVRDADSQIKRDGTKSWWWESMSSRKNNPELSFEVVVGQRVHRYDLAASCKEHGYDVLHLAARFDPKYVTMPSKIGWKDWRTQEGEILWPERFSEKALKEIEDQIGEFAVACQLQQDPILRGGAYIKREWFKRISAADAKFIPGTIQWVRAWDLALSKTGNGNASVQMGIGSNGITYLRRGLFWKLDFPDTLTRIKELSKEEKGEVWVEAIGTTKSAGEQAAAAMLGWAIVEIQTEKNNKVSEAQPWIAAAQAGKLCFIEEDQEDWRFFGWNAGAWIEHFLDRFCGWIPDPNLDQADDEVDCTSLAYKATRGKIPFQGASASERDESLSAYGETSPADERGYT